MAELQPGPEELSSVDRDRFDREIVGAGRPVIFRQLVHKWPVTSAALGSPEALGAYLKNKDNRAPIDTYIASPENEGRHFYDPEMRGFNFQRHQAPLVALIDKLLEISGDPDAMHIYAGSVPSESVVPGFAADNPMALLDPRIEPRLWLGNRSRVAAHFDTDPNIACAVSGERRFTLFPPEQIENLYIGPLDFNMAGPPASLVDFANPDFDRFPKFREAQNAAMVVDLSPGDALFIPPLWWHHVEADGPFNLLVNYWWPGKGTGPAMEALALALLAIRDRPLSERQAWRRFFDHYIFGPDAASAADHIPEHVRSVLGAPSEQRSRNIIGFIMHSLDSKK